ncbi:MAG: stage III sporulation protein AD [Clostridia bacterium]|nr:stage III sporulation protein AD [Clostridia bacterium]MBR6744065.1 stage III sporulation protein AD [Clostridia bacterium]
MNIVQICGFGLLGAITVWILRSFRPEYATAAGIAVGLLLLAGSIAPLVRVMDSVTAIANGTGFSVYASVILKSMGIGILAQTTADVCRDSGVSMIASKVEFAAKIVILLLCVPILETLTSLIEGFLQ